MVGARANVIAHVVEGYRDPCLEGGLSEGLNLAWQGGRLRPPTHRNRA